MGTILEQSPESSPEREVVSGANWTHLSDQQLTDRIASTTRTLSSKALCKKLDDGGARLKNSLREYEAERERRKRRERKDANEHGFSRHSENDEPFGGYADGKHTHGPEDYMTNNYDGEEDTPLTPATSLHASSGDTTNHEEDLNDDHWSQYQFTTDVSSTTYEPTPTQSHPTTEPQVTKNSRKATSQHGQDKRKVSKEAWREKYLEIKENETKQFIEVTMDAQRLKAELQMKNIERQRELDREFSITTCMEAYKSLEGFESDDYRKAFRFFKDAYTREFFLSMPIDERAPWLRNEFDEIRD